MICAGTCRKRGVTTSSKLDRLITEQTTAEILGISRDTLRRLNRRGEGPIRRHISPRRVGYKLSEVEAYRDRKPALARNQDEPQSGPLEASVQCSTPSPQELRVSGTKVTTTLR